MKQFTPTTRLAPSPTGALHLGNARTFLVNWVLAQQREWRVLLRIDDLEGPRVKAGADSAAIEDLRWLGLDWDEPVIYQSTRLRWYEAALSQLSEKGFLYRCSCTRSDVERHATGRAMDGGWVYAGKCRNREVVDLADQSVSLRFRTEGEVTLRDEVLGERQFPSESVGDFIVRKAGGEFGYQLATVVDDHHAGVTHVVRGDDLASSTVRQCFIYRALGIEHRQPTFIHLPLVVGPDGRKLAKRHGDTRLRQLREEGVTAGRVRAMLARWSGFLPTHDECPIAEWIDRFDLSQLPKSHILYDDRADRPS